jgi:hypothetical protein
MNPLIPGESGNPGRRFVPFVQAFLGPRLRGDERLDRGDERLD